MAIALQRRLPTPGSTLLTAWSVWALLLGMGMLMLGNGMQGTLLALRADAEGFSGTVTGLVMSGYFAGVRCRCSPAGTTCRSPRCRSSWRS